MTAAIFYGKTSPLIAFNAPIDVDCLSKWKTNRSQWWIFQQDRRHRRWSSRVPYTSIYWLRRAGNHFCAYHAIAIFTVELSSNMSDMLQLQLWGMNLSSSCDRWLKIVVDMRVVESHLRCRYCYITKLLETPKEKTLISADRKEKLSNSPWLRVDKLDWKGTLILWISRYDEKLGNHLRGQGCLFFQEVHMRSRARTRLIFKLNKLIHTTFLSSLPPCPPPVIWNGGAPCGKDARQGWYWWQVSSMAL